MEKPKVEGSFEEPKINDPAEAANSLIEQFSDLQKYAKEKWAEPPSEKYHTDENQAMAEDDATRFQIEQVEDSFTDFWREDIAPEIKEATVKKLLEMGREDVVKQIHRFSDVSGLVDVETLKRIRGK